MLDMAPTKAYADADGEGHDIRKGNARRGEDDDEVGGQRSLVMLRVPRGSIYGTIMEIGP